MLVSSLLALLAVRAWGAAAAKADGAPDSDGVAPEAGPPQVAAEIKTTFPDAELLGVRLINGQPTKAIVEVTNREAGPITVALLAGSLARVKELPAGAPAYRGILRNLTAVQYNLVIEAGESKALPFSFVQDMQPQEVRLQIIAVVTTDKGIVQVPAHNGTAVIVEAPTGFFDLQIIFLYLVLSAAFAGTLYFVYKTWIEALFPQAKRTKTPKKGKKVLDADAALSGSESAGVSTGASKTYDESWIPDHHIKPPVAKRVKSGTGGKKKNLD